MAELFSVTVKTISEYLQNIFITSELDKDSVIRNFRTTAVDGKNYDTQFYNLDAIIAVGYRVNSMEATRFRIWATKTLREFIIKGFVLDDERLKQGKNFGKDYFEELLERIREIRASERRFYQKITDIYAQCRIDYDPQSDITLVFYKTVQNKLHWAVTGQTSDRVIRMYLDYAENQARRNIAMSMADWVQKLDAFLQFDDYPTLKNAGTISHDIAKKLAEGRPMTKPIIYTVGHSTHPLNIFLSLLREYNINCLVDVRSVAASSYHPQYNKGPLSNFLKDNAIIYMHFPEEFGARHSDPGLLDEKGKVDFAKVRKSGNFKNGVDRLWLGINKGYTIALMCSESDPFDCHRFSMITVALQQDGFEVLHIMKDKTLKSTSDLEQLLLKKYASQLPKPNVFQPNVTLEDQLNVAYRLRNMEIAFSPQRVG
jgi:hypothetical protein